VTDETPDPPDGWDTPADLWPAGDGAAPAAPAPRRWVWAAMEPADRRERLRELAVWVDWLRRTFELHNQVPACWYRHPPVVEHLTALYVGWLRTYAGEPGTGVPEADWINTLHGFVPRLQLAACAAGTHQPPPPAPPVPAPGDFATFVETSPEMTDPADHPAAAELARQAAAADQPL
jgi:hypothetical protein